MQPKVIGEPKFGLRLRVEQGSFSLTLEARPDPFTLYIVIGAALAVGVFGGLLFSPKQGLVTFIVFSLLFLPLIGILLLNKMRVRCTCVLDRGRGLLQIDEQSLTRRIQEVYQLDDVGAVIVRRLPSSPLAGSAWSYGLFLDLGAVEYLAACSNSEQTVGQDAWRISRFLSIPLEVASAPSQERQTYRRLFATAIVVYVLPVVLAVATLLLILQQAPGIDAAFAGLLSALLISQIGAILAFIYYRTQRPYET